MTINVQSTTDSEETVTAAMGGLAQSKPVEDAPKETAEVKATAESDESSDTGATEAESQETDSEEENDTEELEAKENDQEGERPKKKSGFQKRIDRMNKKMSAVEQEREYWRQEALRAQQSKGPAKTEEPETKALNQPDPNEPKPDQFETHDQYVRALARYEAKQELQAEKEAARKAAIKNESQTKLEKHTERVNSFKASHDDFDDVLENVGNIPLSITVRESIVDSENGPELMYELAKNPKELQRICSLTPINAAREIGKIEARFSKTSESSSVEKKTSKAPAPVTPVRTRGSISTKSIYDAENLSQREYEKLRAEQIKSARS